MTDYTGLYVQRLTSGAIFNVLVADSAGNRTNLDEQDYRHRAIEPALESLPSKEDWESNKAG